MYLLGEASVSRRGLKGERASERDAKAKGGGSREEREKERESTTCYGNGNGLSLLSPGLSRRFSSKRAINDAYTPWPHHHDRRGGVWWSPVVAMRRRRSQVDDALKSRTVSRTSSRLSSTRRFFLSSRLANLSIAARSMDPFDHARNAMKCRSSGPAKNR